MEQEFLKSLDGIENEEFWKALYQAGNNLIDFAVKQKTDTRSYQEMAAAWKPGQLWV